jgi:hypothetical protein
MLKTWTRCNLNDHKCNCINIYKSIKKYNIEIGVLLELKSSLQIIFAWRRLKCGVEGCKTIFNAYMRAKGEST